VDLGDLLPKPEDIEAAKRTSFEHSTLMRFLKDVGAPPDKIKAAKKHARYDLALFKADFPGCPIDIHVTRIDSYSVQSLFETPTKSPVYQAFEALPPDDEGRSQILFFKAQGFTTLVIGDSVMLMTQTFLTTRIRRRTLYVTTYGDLAESLRDARILEA
jgi:hypothetical protein